MVIENIWQYLHTEQNYHLNLSTELSNPFQINNWTLNKVDLKCLQKSLFYPENPGQSGS
jgi:hypothetical protein